MNELEIREKSAVIYEASQEIHINNQKDLDDVVEILKGVKQHRKKIVEYWKNAKTLANIVVSLSKRSVFSAKRRTQLNILKREITF